MIVLHLYKKTHIGYTQYVDNAVYVDDVDDAEAGANAYFFCSGTAMPPSTVINRRVHCHGQACNPNRAEGKPFYWISMYGAFQPEVCVFFSGNTYVKCQFSTSE